MNKLEKAIKSFLENIYMPKKWSSKGPTKKQLSFMRREIGKSVAKKIEEYTPAWFVDIEPEQAWQYSPISTEITTEEHYCTLDVETKHGKFSCQVANTPYDENANFVLVSIQELKNTQNGRLNWRIGPILLMIKDYSKIPKNEVPASWSKEDQERLVKENYNDRMVYILNRKWDIYEATNLENPSVEDFATKVPWITKLKKRKIVNPEGRNLPMVDSWRALLEMNGTQIIVFRCETSKWRDSNGADVEQEDIELYFD